MTIDAQQAELDILVRARFPLIYLVSWEEDRAEKMLARLATAQGKKIFFWTVTQGMCDVESACDPSIKTAEAALDYVFKSDTRAVFVLKDFHAYLQDATVIRRMRDLVDHLTTTSKTVVILSPQLTLPMELEKDTTVVDYDLPGADELRELLDQVVEASQNGTRYPVTLPPADADRLLQSILGLTLTEAESTLAKAIVQNGKLDLEAIDVALHEIKQIIRKSRMLEYYEAREDIDQIGGLDILKEWLVKRGKAFSPKAREYGLPQPRGILVLGVQGCGKSMTCKAISGLWKLPLLRLDMGSIFGGFIGQSEENMRRAIKTAESVAPCILWLDEIEKGLSGTQSSNTSDAGTTARVFSTFLTWLQEKTKPVFVAATANNIQSLPPELLRKGRLDELFFIDLPTAPERRDIFSIHLQKRKRDPAAFQLDVLAAASDGFSGAEIEQTIVSSLYDAFDQDRDITQSDLETTVRATIPLSKTMQEDIERLRQWSTSRTRPASSGAR